MAITIGTHALLLSTLGGMVCVSGKGDEKIITAKSDGASIPGMIVAVVGTATFSATSGDIVGTDKGAVNWLTGILLPKYDVDCDTKIDDGLLVEIVIPKAGKLYNVHIEDPSGNFAAGTPFAIHTTPGEMVVQDGALEDMYYSAILTKNILDGSLFAEVRWT